MKTKEAFHRAHPTWCRGCGLFGVFDALKRAAAKMDLAAEDMVIVTGIGCHGRMNNYFRAYGFHGLHGRTMPVATGIKLANPRLKVIGVSGDGDAYSIGMGHFIHTVRKNVGLLYIVVDNRIYALTQGQMSPTTEFGMVTISTPFGSRDYPIDGPCLALAAGGTFIARGFSAEVAHLASLIEKGMNHDGFALIDVLSPCVTHNKQNTYAWYKENIVMVEEEPGYNPGDKNRAWELLNHPGKIPVGLIYEEEKPSFEELVLPDKNRPMALDRLSVHRRELEKIMENFR
ncbi:MAG: 2-oxoacid:ferredoxin oxidoreductase subunit beta [Candidatus Aminicenantes bacterium]|nr:2-oxoacid:ferredoxin oxidoreductase subunit beta [Candidatus Aminicenantes bacterium]